MGVGTTMTDLMLFRWQADGNNGLTPSVKAVTRKPSSYETPEIPISYQTDGIAPKQPPSYQAVRFDSHQERGNESIPEERKRMAPNVVSNSRDDFLALTAEKERHRVRREGSLFSSSKFFGLVEGFKATAASLVVGSLVWVEDPDEAWVDGEVVEINKEDIKVLCTSGQTVAVKASNVYPKDADAPSCGVDDMTKLAYLHEPGVLQNLRSRYDMNEIYTYVGNILIAVNPFMKLPHLYDSHMMAQYKGAGFGELSPHPFAVADNSYR
ncbi:unnamed protein product [Dovyalis caffra]|uniref:Uncharacterized protein n=1 Tax=Dovyalis caffra TaxID=77055 RepID=A0AAV1SEN9_9ROSI|nr:unnamed protein product [Dovyalis caffra]